MATTTTNATMKPTTPTTTAPSVKKSGPPVPPRPQHTLAAASLLKAQRESAANKQQQQKSPNGIATTTKIANAKVTVSTAAPTSEVKGSSVGVGAGIGAGRTIIYKSPSINLEKKQEEREKRSVGVGRTMSAPKPPLKLRKAPDVPVPKPKPNQLESTTKPTTPTSPTTPPPPKTTAAINNRLETKLSSSSSQQANDSNNIIIVQSSNGATLSRHNSMGSPKSIAGLRDTTRLSLDGSKNATPMLQLEQLKPSQPLPRPRKIVKVPVATLDVDDLEPPANNDNNNTNGNVISNCIFRRSKTTLDNLASRANITTISTVSASNSFLGGKTVEIKNNLKNAAERLFSEIIVNQQQKHTHANENTTSSTATTIITKHERAIQHQALLELEREQEQQQQQKSCKVTVVTSSSTPAPNRTSNNFTRININSSNANNIQQKSTIDVKNSIGTTTEKKIAFHEMLISELTAMRTKSSSMEALSTSKSLTESSLTSAMLKPMFSPSRQQQNQQQESSNNKSVAVTDSEDVDADNVEDVDDDDNDNDNHINDDDDLSKRLKTGANNTPRKRCPSGCSSDSSPYGTERSSRIRTSDWIEVGDNGKKVTMSSCHISLEDSGLEDEERLSSSGVGDSWDSVKEVENAKRSRSVQRAMSITELPPLPKSLSGFNKLLGSDSGLLSDSHTKIDKNSNELDKQKDTSHQFNGSMMSDDKANNNNSNNKSNNINNEDSGLENTLNQSSKENDNDANTTTTITTTTESTSTSNRAPSASSTLDKQLATLKKEMYGLRQLDLSLLSQLWALNDSIQEFRTILQEQEEDDDQSYSPHSPSPSSYDSVSSDGEDEVHIAKQKMLGAKPKIITTQPKLLSAHNNNKANDIKISALNSANIEANNNSNNLKVPQKPIAPLPLNHKPHVLPRMRSAPPPPPSSSLKTQQTPTRQT